ncbi:MAG TPA: hypothetical protein VLT59_13060 [Steroidobacteraceae bacterium]|nr:hypothetical protein [Steroidobacteraceae bacterium]
MSSIGCRRSWSQGLLALVCVFGVTASFASEISDAVTRAEFGFYAGEPGTIASAIAALERLDAGPHEELRTVHLAYAHWKLAQLRSPDDPAGALAAAERCVEALEAVVDLRTTPPEALAVQSACYGLLASLGGVLKAPLNSLRSARRMEAALAIAPDNPRVRYIEGLREADRPAAPGGDPAKAHQKLRDAVVAFETDGELAVGDEPRWGHAEALAWLGKSYFELGDLIAARESLERALIIAPDYAWAQRLLTGLARPR